MKRILHIRSGILVCLKFAFIVISVLFLIELVMMAISAPIISVRGIGGWCVFIIWCAVFLRVFMPIRWVRRHMAFFRFRN